MPQPSKEQARDRKIIAYLYEEEYQSILEFAKMQGISMSDVLRKCFLENRRNLQKEIAKFRKMQQE